MVCGGLQDNGSWCTPAATNMTYGISFKDAFNVGGGDGMHAAFVRRPYAAGQLAERRHRAPGFDNDGTPVDRPGAAGGETSARQARAIAGIGPLRSLFRRTTRKPFTPAANVVFRSDDRGVTWKAISPDLTAHIDRDKLEMMGAPVGPRALVAA